MSRKQGWILVLLAAASCGETDSDGGSASDSDAPDVATPDASDAGIDAADGATDDGEPPGQCDAGLTTCSGSCVDVSTDAANCGYCGHDCRGGGCANGACQPVVVGKTNALDHPGGLQVDDLNVYFSFGWGAGKSGLARMPINGGAAVPLLQGQSWINRLALTSSSLLWTEYGSQPGTNGMVATMPKKGGTLTPVVAGLAYPTTLAIGATHIYYAMQGWSIHRVPLAGGTSELLWSTSGPYDAIDIAVDSTHVYFSLLGVAGSIQKIPLTGGAATLLAWAANHPYSVAVGGGHVYWADVGTPPTYSDGSISRVPINGGAGEVFAPSQCQPESVQLDGEYAYWATYCGGTVARMPIKGGPIRVLAAGQAGPSSLALNDDEVYWTNTLGYEIMKVAK